MRNQCSAAHIAFGRGLGIRSGHVTVRLGVAANNRNPTTNMVQTHGHALPACKKSGGRYPGGWCLFKHQGPHSCLSVSP